MPSLELDDPELDDPELDDPELADPVSAESGAIVASSFESSVANDCARTSVPRCIRIHGGDSAVATKTVFGSSSV